MRYAGVSSASRSIAGRPMSHVAAAETDAPSSAPGAAEIDEERPLGMDLPRRVKALVTLQFVAVRK